MSAKCKTCGAPVNLAPDGDPKYEVPPNYEARYNEALRLIELIYYREGKSPEWRAAHMNGVTRDALGGHSFSWAKRLFPNHFAQQEGE